MDGTSLRNSVRLRRQKVEDDDKGVLSLKKYTTTLLYNIMYLEEVHVQHFPENDCGKRYREGSFLHGTTV